MEKEERVTYYPFPYHCFVIFMQTIICIVLSAIIFFNIPFPSNALLLFYTLIGFDAFFGAMDILYILFYMFTPRICIHQVGIDRKVKGEIKTYRWEDFKSIKKSSDWDAPFKERLLQYISGIGSGYISHIPILLFYKDGTYIKLEPEIDIIKSIRKFCKDENFINMLNEKCKIGLDD